MGIFSRIRRREKRKNTCAHKFLFETTKLPAEAVYHKYRKKRTSKTNISSYLSRSCTTVIDDRFSNTGRTGSPCQRSAFNLEALDASSGDTGRGASRNWPFLSPVPTSTWNNRTNQTKPHTYPRSFYGLGLGLSDHLRKVTSGHRQAWRGCRKSREEVPSGFRRFLGSAGWHARQAGRALDADRVQSGQREESIAQRRRNIPPVGKREELRTRTACRSGQREETGGNEGFGRLFSVSLSS